MKPVPFLRIAPNHVEALAVVGDVVTCEEVPRERNNEIGIEQELRGSARNSHADSIPTAIMREPLV